MTITKYQNYTDRELLRQIEIFLACCVSETPSYAEDLLEEVKERMPNWIDLPRP